MDSCDLIIAGAGPAGLAAAIAAARSGASVLVLEKNDRPGRKLLMTGGGNCNIWDPETPPLEALKPFGRSGLFLRQALAAFDWAGFLGSIRVETENRSGTVFVSGGARAMLEKLLGSATESGAGVELHSPLRAVDALEKGGFEVQTENRSITCRQMIVATGGITYPGTGSSGDGYELAEVFGHEIDLPSPALGEMETDPCFPDLAGTSLNDAEISFALGKKSRAGGRGGLLLTHSGISGPAALNASLEIVRAGREPGQTVAVDLLPAMNTDQAVEALVARARSETKRSIGTAGLGELLSVRLLARIAELAGVKPDRRMASISFKEHRKIAALLKGLSLTVTALPDADRAMVTLGGVRTSCIDPRSMESRLQPGLFFAGEVLSPAGPCGGYNLLMAFATGWMAGAAACSGE